MVLLVPGRDLSGQVGNRPVLRCGASPKRAHSFCRDLERSGLDVRWKAFGRVNLTDIDTMNIAEARSYLEAGHFAPGSMRPKIRAAIDFLENGGKEVIITEPHLMEDAMHGQEGTHVVP